MKKRIVLMIAGFVLGLLLFTAVPANGKVYASDKRADFEIHMKPGWVGLLTCDHPSIPPTAVNVGGGYLEVYCPAAK